MQCIYNYIPKTDRVSRLCNVAATLWLQFMVYVMIHDKCYVLYFSIIIRRMCAVLNIIIIIIIIITV